MGTTTALRRALKADFYPVVQAKGFLLETTDQPQFTRFRRDSGDVVHLFDIQWDKGGKPLFVVNFGEAPNRPFEFYGQTIQPNELRTHHSPSYLRLQRTRGGSMNCWYQLSRPFLSSLLTLGKKYEPEEVVAQLLTHFSEVESWWNTKARGPHVHHVRDA